MDNYDHSITLLKNLKNNKSISANELMDILKSIIMETEDINGKLLSESTVTDEKTFASGLSFLCRNLSETIRCNNSVLNTLSAMMQKHMEKHIETIKQAESDLEGVQKQIEEESKKLTAAEEKKGELMAEQANLKKEIDTLSNLDKKIDEIKADIIVKEDIRDELLAKAGDKQRIIEEYQNGLRAIRNSWCFAYSDSEIDEILKNFGVVSLDKSEIASYSQLRSWFDQYEAALNRGMETYTSMYQTVLKVMDSTQTGEEKK